MLLLTECDLQSVIFSPSLVSFLLPTVGVKASASLGREELPEDNFIHGEGTRGLQKDARVLFHPYLLSTCYVPGTVLGSGDVMASKNVTVLTVRAIMVAGGWGGRGGHPLGGGRHDITMGAERRHLPELSVAAGSTGMGTGRSSLPPEPRHHT